MSDTPVVRQDCHVHLNVFDCLNCQGESILSQEPGVEWYKCPLCQTEKARARYVYTRPDPTLECACGNKLFAITQKGIYCPNCGRDITGQQE